MMDLRQYGYRAEDTPMEGLVAGRVTALWRDRYTVITGQGEMMAVLKGSFLHDVSVRAEYPCVGDFVWLRCNPGGTSQIARVMPRRSIFSRADFSGHAVAYAKTILEQMVAANFDYVFIVTSLNRDFKVSRIARYLAQARGSGGMPVVLLTKADLADDLHGPVAQVQEAAPDVPVHAISSHTGYGMEALDAYLMPGQTAVFLGMSGVGKSSLLNALMRREVMAVNAIREDDSRGRHTTTHRQLFMLPSGAMVIDTPGMREMGLFDAEDGIEAGFADIAALLAQCRFSDCHHRTEPGCAILAALADGSLPAERWESYLAQAQENRYVEDRAGYMADRRAWHKQIATENRRKKKSGGIRR